MADTVCHMFSGWRLFGDYAVLHKLGSGLLSIDVLVEQTCFDGAPLQSLVIASELNRWVRRDLAEHEIPIDGIEAVTLEVQLDFRKIAAADRRTNDQHLVEGRVQSPAEFVACAIRSRSRVVTEEKVYESLYEDLKEWPEDWAKHVVSPRHA